MSQPKPVAIGALLADLAAAERPAYLERYLRTEIAAVLGLRDETIIDERTRLFDFGMDSLMAVELKNRIEAGLRCSVRATLLFDYPTIEVLIPYLLNDVLHLSTASAVEAMPPDSSMADTELEAKIDQFTSAELLAFISQKYEEKA